MRSSACARECSEEDVVEEAQLEMDVLEELVGLLSSKAAPLIANPGMASGVGPVGVRQGELGGFFRRDKLAKKPAQGKQKNKDVSTWACEEAQA